MATPNYAQDGGFSQEAFNVHDQLDTSKQLQINLTPLATGKQIQIVADPTNDGKFTLPPVSSAVLGMNSLVTQTSIPVTTGTVTVSATTQWYLAVPAGTLTTLNINLPSTPPNGSVVRITSTQAITNLNMGSQGSDTFAGAPTSLTANSPVGFAYLTANTNWYRI